MEKIPFTKPALSIPQQIGQLQNRGLVIKNTKRTATILANTNYYRLSGYWMYFEASRAPHQFAPNTTFKQVLTLYEFNRQLRTLFFEGISRIEVSLRTQWAYQMGMHYGSHSYLDTAYANNMQKYQTNLSKVKSEQDRSKESFIKHYKAKYAEKFPPVWVVCEILSFGNLAGWYNNLVSGKAKDDIAAHYEIDCKLLESWIHSLAVFRNMCAHQARLVGRIMQITPMRPKSKKITIASCWNEQSLLPYNTILVILFLHQKIVSTKRWQKHVCSLLRKNRALAERFLGFPAEWETKPFWRTL